MNTYLSRNFILGMLFLAIAIGGYGKVTNYFSYGGGWPFVQIFFLALYLIGVRCIFKSGVPRSVKLIFCFGWIVWVVVNNWGKVE